MLSCLKRFFSVYLFSCCLSSLEAGQPLSLDEQSPVIQTDLSKRQYNIQQALERAHQATSHLHELPDNLVLLGLVLAFLGLNTDEWQPAKRSRSCTSAATPFSPLST